VILEICSLIRTSLRATLAARQKGEGNIRNGEQVIINLTTVPSFTEIVDFVATQQVPYQTVQPMDAGANCKMEGSPCLN